MNLLRSLGFLLLLLSITGEYTSTGSCQNYNASSQSCLRYSLNKSGISYIFAACPAGAVCIISNGSGKCTTPLGINDTCLLPSQCQSGFCVGLRCAPAGGSEGAKCSSPLDCAQGLFCATATSRCTKVLAFNTTCDIKDILNCLRGFCNPSKGLCDTANSMAKAYSWPKLIGANVNGYKRCSMATLDSNCTYLSGNITKPASDLKKKCINTQFSDTVESYCELGGGEEAILNEYRNVSNCPKSRCTPL